MDGRYRSATVARIDPGETRPAAGLFCLWNPPVRIIREEPQLHRHGFGVLKLRRRFDYFADPGSLPTTPAGGKSSGFTLNYCNPDRPL